MDRDRERGAGSHECQCSYQDRRDGYSFTELLVPVLAGFTLPTIIIFASDVNAGKPYHDTILALLITATGCFWPASSLLAPW
jgi:hypothetical protein